MHFAELFCSTADKSNGFFFALHWNVGIADDIFIGAEDFRDNRGFNANSVTAVNQSVKVRTQFEQVYYQFRIHIITSGFAAVFDVWVLTRSKKG